MTRHRAISFVAGAFMFAGLATPVMAQPYGFGPGMMMGPMMGGGGMMGFGPGGRFGFCNPGTMGFAGWRIERIKQVISPNEQQSKLLDDLRAASEKALETASASCPNEWPATSAERLALMEKRMEAMLAAIKTVRPAYEAFYAALDDGQKKKLDSVGPRGPRGGGWRERWER